MPTILRHAPISDFGIGLVDLYISQDCSWIQSILDHTWTDSPTSTLLTVAFEDAQLEMGIPDGLMKTPAWTPLRWLTIKSWIQSCLHFLWENQIEISPSGSKIKPQ